MLALVFKVLAFYVENQAAVSAYMSQYDRELDELCARHPQRITLEMLRERLRARDAVRATEPAHADTSA